MEIENLFGLPAHPLIVHGAVVLVPLAAIGTILIVASRKLRARLGVAVAVLAVVGFGFAYLAKESGQALEERVDESAQVHEHAELGDTVPLVALVLAASAVGVAGLDVWERRRAGAPASSAPEGASAGGAPPAPGWVRPVAIAVSALAVVASVGATVQVGRAGHTGAEATWEGVDQGGEGREAGDDEDHDAVVVPPTADVAPAAAPTTAGG